MRRGRRTRWWDWLACVVMFLVAIGLLGAAEFGRRHGTTPEDELTIVTGRATNATDSSFDGRNYLRFTVQGQTVNYADSQPSFARVVDAIRRGALMTIGVSTKRETLLPRNGWVPLYSLSIEGKTILTYQETVTKGYRGSNAIFIVAGTLLLLSAWALLTCYRNRNATPLTPAEQVSVWNDPKQVRTAAVLWSVAVYGTVMFAMLYDDSQKTTIQAFGEKPLGMPPRMFVCVLFSVLMIPLPFAAWHGFRLLFRQMSDGGTFGLSGLFRSMFTTPMVHPELKRSQFIVLVVIAFYVALMIGWAIYAG